MKVTKAQWSHLYRTHVAYLESQGHPRIVAELVARQTVDAAVNAITKVVTKAKAGGFKKVVK